MITTREQILIKLAASAYRTALYKQAARGFRFRTGGQRVLKRTRPVKKLPWTTRVKNTLRAPFTAAKSYSPIILPQLAYGAYTMFKHSPLWGTQGAQQDITNLVRDVNPTTTTDLRDTTRENSNYSQSPNQAQQPQQYGAYFPQQRDNVSYEATTAANRQLEENFELPSAGLQSNMLSIPGTASTKRLLTLGKMRLQ